MGPDQNPLLSPPLAKSMGAGPYPKLYFISINTVLADLLIADILWLCYCSSLKMARLVLLLLISAAVVCKHAYCFPKYADELPSLPTVNGVVVKGVGHVNPQGKGALNPFGQASVRERVSAPSTPLTLWMQGQQQLPQMLLNLLLLGAPVCHPVVGPKLLPCCCCPCTGLQEGRTRVDREAVQGRQRRRRLLQWTRAGRPQLLGESFLTVSHTPGGAQHKCNRSMTSCPATPCSAPLPLPAPLLLCLQWKKGMASPARGPTSHPGLASSKP
jgi:hypothetical protein